MFKLTEDERAANTLVTDSTGRDVLAGLTVEETELLIMHRRKFIDALYGRGEREHANKRAFVELHEKHEKARLEILGTEHAIKTHSPTKH